MPEMITGKKTQQHSTEFKVKALEWRHQAHQSMEPVLPNGIKMKIHHVMVAMLVISGCASGPRSYDGVLGYRTEPLPAGLQVTYVDEADSSTETILSHIADVCNDAFGPASTALSVEVTSVTEYDRQVNMSIPIPVGVQTIGTYSNGGGGLPGATVQSSVTQTDTVYRTIKLKEVVALCSTAT